MWLLAFYLTLHVTLSLTSIQTFHLTYIIYNYIYVYIDVLHVFCLSDFFLSFDSTFYPLLRGGSFYHPDEEDG